MMFFYEQKAKRLKKIKSKKYHKILKKEKLKKELSLHEIAMLDPEKAAQMKEKMLTDRAAVLPLILIFLLFLFLFFSLLIFFFFFCYH